MYVCISRSENETKKFKRKNKLVYRWTLFTLILEVLIVFEKICIVGSMCETRKQELRHWAEE